MNGFCATCGNVLPNHRAACFWAQRQRDDVVTVEPGRTISVNGRAVFRLAPVITESGANAIAPSTLDRMAHVVADALRSNARELDLLRRS